LGSGQLVSIHQTAHYQPITKLKFAPGDDSLAVSAGKDGLVQVWNLADLLAKSGQNQLGKGITPRHKWAAHNLPVTDLHISSVAEPRVYSTSLDQTCKIHSVHSGDLLLHLIFDSATTAVTAHPADYRAFVGTMKGKIYQIDLFEKPPANQQRYFGSNIDGDSRTFFGHQNRVTALSVNLEGIYLASGGEDFQVKIWHIDSRQCLQTIDCKGPVTTVRYMLMPKTLDSQNPQKLSLPVQPLQKQVTAVTEIVVPSNYDGNSEWILKRQAEIDSKMNDLIRMAKEEEAVGYRDGKEPDGSVECEGDLKAKLADMKRINGELYRFVVDEILK